MKNRLLKFLFAVSTFFWINIAFANPQEIVQLADYISVDYSEAVKNGVIVNDVEYKEMEEFSKRISQLGTELNLDPNVMKNMQQLDNLIKNKAQPDEVAAKARAISTSVSREFVLIIPPKTAPDLMLAKALYQQNCAACHGDAGHGDGPLAANQEPAPTNFTDIERAKLRSINGLYNTITMGVEETGMIPYQQQLTDAERWSLAFYVSQLFASDEQIAKGKTEWKNLSDKSEFTPERIVSRTPNEEIADGQSIELLAYLRQNPSEIWPSQQNLWLVTQQLLDKSLEALNAGDPKTAYKFSLNAYLEGFELLEPVIDILEPQKRQELEILMISYRQAIQNNDKILAAKILPEIKAELTALQAEVSTKESNFATVLLSALIILLREGLEIILVLAVMFMLVKRMEQKSAMPYIHAGWISAIVAGLGLWYVSHQFITISGANREITEVCLLCWLHQFYFMLDFGFIDKVLSKNGNKHCKAN